MPSLFSLLTCKPLHFELCNVTQSRTRQVSSSHPPTGGETDTQTIVQTVHTDTAPTCSLFPLVPYVPIISFIILLLCFLPVCLLTKASSVSYYPCANNTDCIVGIYLVMPAFVCQFRVWIDRLEAGSHAGLLFLKLGEQVGPHWSLRGLKVHKEMSR